LPKFPEKAGIERRLSAGSPCRGFDDGSIPGRRASQYRPPDRGSTLDLVPAPGAANPAFAGAAT